MFIFECNHLRCTTNREQTLQNGNRYRGVPFFRTRHTHSHASHTNKRTVSTLHWTGTLTPATIEPDNNKLHVGQARVCRAVGFHGGSPKVDVRRRTARRRCMYRVTMIKTTLRIPKLATCQSTKRERVPIRVRGPIRASHDRGPIRASRGRGA